MKTTDKITLTVLAVGIGLCLALYMMFPGTHWGVYVGLLIGTCLAIPKAIEGAARDKVARQVLDQ